MCPELVDLYWSTLHFGSDSLTSNWLIKFFRSKILCLKKIKLIIIQIRNSLSKKENFLQFKPEISYAIKFFIIPINIFYFIKVVYDSRFFKCFGPLSYNQKVINLKSFFAQEFDFQITEGDITNKYAIYKIH